MYGHGMKLIIDRLDENYDPATLYHFRAMYEEAINSNPDKAFELEKQAFEHCDENNTFAFKINSNLGYYYHHFGNRELAELHYRNAFSLCNRRIETLEDFNDVILATRQYINLIIDSDRIIEALDILEKWITRIYEQFGEINSPYADMVFFKGVVSFKSENEKSGWHCFREAVRIYSVIYENNADEQREKIEMIIKVIKSFNLTPSPDYDDFTEQITGKTAVLL
jgi:tetratricopeptide (TPR) repeat protein